MISPAIGVLALVVLIVGAGMSPLDAALRDPAQRNTAADAAKAAPLHSENTGGAEAADRTYCWLDHRCLLKVVFAAGGASVSSEVHQMQQGSDSVTRPAFLEPGVELPPPRS